ncbi:MAG: hypothetical protein M3376_01580 [Actinomycetota bacterium]|nr:hypothetical protein [Actinomycetota bacterium]
MLQAREVGHGVILAQVRGNLSVPAGAGEAEAVASVVLVGEGEDHQIATFHNTPVASGR